MIIPSETIRIGFVQMLNNLIVVALRYLKIEFCQINIRNVLSIQCQHLL